MRKTLAMIYHRLHKIIEPRKISRSTEQLVRPHGVRPNLESAYAEMARDEKRESEALEWAEITFKETTRV